jgi:hypothetical protein
MGLTSLRNVRDSKGLGSRAGLLQRVIAVSHVTWRDLAYEHVVPFSIGRYDSC